MTVLAKLVVFGIGMGTACINGIETSAGATDFVAGIVVLGAIGYPLRRRPA